MENLKSKIIELISTALDKPINDIERLFPSEEVGWSDPVTWYKRNNRDYAKIDAHYTKSFNRSSHIFRRLGHIVVNPHHKLNTEALITSYVYSSAVNNVKIGDNFIVNANEKASLTFVKEMINAAREQRDIALRLVPDPISARINSKTYILHGKRGLGKTFFLNHILSKYSGIFDEEDTIWVRINLVENFPMQEGSESTYLINWIYAQIAKIVFRYYDVKSKRYDWDNPKRRNISLSSELRQFVGENFDTDKKYKRDLLDKIVNIENEFYGNQAEIPLSTSLVPLALGKKIFNLVLEQGYSFIVVLDGLDRLEATQYHQDKFNKLLSQANELIINNAPIGMIILPVTRTNTLHSIPSASYPYKSNNVVKFSLAGADILTILERRRKYLENEIFRIAIQQNNEIDWPISDWPDHLNDFMEFFRQRDDSYKSLEKIFSANMRAQTQSVQVNYLEFLHEMKEKLYKLTESLACAGNHFPVQPYRYSIKDGKYIRNTTDEKKFDHHLLPSVMLFPYLSYSQNSEYEINDIPDLKYILAGVRILQLIEAHERIIAEAKNVGKHVDRLKTREIADLCYILFQYRRDLILLLLEELNEYEIISLGGDEGFPVATENTMQIIYPMPKMKQFLEVYLNDTAYINMMAMRIPTSCQALESVFPFFRANYFSPRNISGWITDKIINCISLCRLVCFVNNLQKNYFNLALSSIEKERYLRIASTALDQIKIFKIGKEMRQEVASNIENAILPSISNHDIFDSLHSKLRSYAKAW